MIFRAMLSISLSIVAADSANAQVTAADVRVATRWVDENPANREIARFRAVDELKRQRRINFYQRVEVDGIIAHDPTPERFAKYFDGPRLQPAHSSTDPLPPEPQGDRNWWERAKDWATRNSHAGENAARDIQDLFDDKTGHLTNRGLETLRPIMGDEVTVNEIVAHSWGAVLLHNAILEGVIKPPRRIVVVGVPDGDLRKWKMLADNTGTDVVIVMNKDDHAAQAAGIVDGYNDLDVKGANKRYNDGGVADRWRAWKRAHPDQALPQQGEFRSWTIDIPSEGNITGHDRFKYYNALVIEGVLTRTAAEMAQDERDAIVERAAELREEQIRSAADSVSHVRQLSEGHRRQDMSPPPPVAAPIDGYWQTRALSALSQKACSNPMALTREDMMSIGAGGLIEGLPGQKEFSAALTGCARQVFDIAAGRFGRGGSLTREDFAYWVDQYRQQEAASHQPLPSVNDGIDDSRGSKGDGCVTPPGSPRACPK